MLTRPLDTYQVLETPESIDLELHLAGPIARAMAFSIDLGIRLLIQFVLFIVLWLADDVGTALWLIGMFLMEWFYPVFFEVLFDGQTPGKKSLGIKVIHDNGTPVGWSASIVRNLLRVVDFLPIAYIVGLISMSISEGFKRLGDLAAGTVVVYNSTSQTTRKVESDRPAPPPIPLSITEQQALLNFSERQDSFSKDRQHELANHLSDVLGTTDDQAVQRINQISRWLMGAR